MKNILLAYEILRKFSKDFLRKLRKMHYFSIFFKKFNKPRVNFLFVWTKNANCWKFWEKFRKKLRKMHYFSIFFNKFNKPCVNFFTRLDERRILLGNFEKIFDENFIEKLNFYFIFIGKFVTKNRAFGNNTIFLQQFFRFLGGGGGGRGFPPPHWLRPWQ